MPSKPLSGGPSVHFTDEELRYIQSRCMWDTDSPGRSVQEKIEEHFSCDPKFTKPMDDAEEARVRQGVKKG